MNRQLRYTRRSIENVQQNARHGFAHRRAMALYGLDAIYTFIPKNACSTLRYSVAIHNGHLQVGDDPNWIHANNATFMADQRQLAEARYTFVVLRCPYRRLVSAYLDKVVSANLSARVLVAKSGSQQDIEAVTAPEIHALNFVDFARICLAPRSGHVDFHWYPQKYFLVYEDYDDWFSVEAFDQATAVLAERGFAVHDTRDTIEHSTTRFEKVDGAFARVPAGELHRLKQAGQVPRYEALFDDEARALVAHNFAADIRLYAEKIGPKGLMFAP